MEVRVEIVLDFRDTSHNLYSRIHITRIPQILQPRRLHNLHRSQPCTLFLRDKGHTDLACSACDISSKKTVFFSGALNPCSAVPINMKLCPGLSCKEDMS